MRVKLSGSVEIVEALEAAAKTTSSVSVEGPPQRNESAELRLGVAEVITIVVLIKDIAELAKLCWEGIQVLRTHSTKQKLIPLEFTTPSRLARVEVALDSTRDQVEELFTRSLS